METIKKNKNKNSTNLKLPSFTIAPRKNTTFLCHIHHRPKQIFWVLDHMWKSSLSPLPNHSKFSLLSHFKASRYCCLYFSFNPFLFVSLTLLCAVLVTTPLAFTTIHVDESSRLINPHLKSEYKINREANLDLTRYDTKKKPQWQLCLIHRV